MTTKKTEFEAVATGRENAVPRWAGRLAHLVPLLALPLCLWRLPFTVDFTMGTGQPPMGLPLWMSVSYVGGLSVMSELFALGCFSLVRPWGEVAPRWIPAYRGKRIPPYLVIVPATTGGLAITALLVGWVLAAFPIAGLGRDRFDNAWWEALAVSTSGLFVLCGPIVLVLTYAYYQRRCRKTPRDH